MTPVKVFQQFGHKLSLKFWFGLHLFGSFLREGFFFLAATKN